MPVLCSGKLLFTLTGHQALVRDLVFAPNGSLTLVSASRDKTLRIWDLAKKGQSDFSFSFSATLYIHCNYRWCVSDRPEIVSALFEHVNKTNEMRGTILGKLALV